jgi:hypothetical protein
VSEKKCEVIEGYCECEELVTVYLVRYICSLEVCSEVQFLLNILVQVKRYKRGAIILFNYLSICNSSRKMCFGNSLCFIYL